VESPYLTPICYHHDANDGKDFIIASTRIDLFSRIEALFPNDDAMTEYFLEKEIIEERRGKRLERKLRH